ncbi:MAG: fibronectin type III domain-containing protein, partial [Thermoplasmata archaeon]
CTLIDNKIHTDGHLSSGIFIRESIYHTLKENEVYTGGEYSYGIDLWMANLSDIYSNNVCTSGVRGYGIALIDTLANRLSKNNITTTGFDAHGVHIDKGYASVSDTKITSNSDDVAAVNDGNLTLKNCNFNTVESSNGIVQVKNNLYVQVYNSDGITPLEGADVEILDNNKMVYASPGYAGYAPTTDEYGRIIPVSLTDRWYYYSDTATENITDIKVKKSADMNWEEVRPDVDMSTPHTEIFIVSMNIAPEVPTGFKVTKVPETNTLNISWEKNSNTYQYTIFTNKTGIWKILDNITHPKNWTLDKNLDYHKWYYYKIQAFSKGGLHSDVSPSKGYYLYDILRPEIPSGLKGSPVFNDDAINLSWNLAIEEIAGYEIVWNDTTTGKWVQIANISHPENWYVWRSKNLISGNTYDFKIRVWDKTTTASLFSNPISVIHLDFLAPRPPSNLIAETISETSIRLSWDASLDPDVLYYRVYVKQFGSGSGGSYSFLKEVSSLNSTIDDLDEDTEYYFAVRAFDEAHNPSIYSIEAWTKTLPASRPYVVVTYPENDSIGIAVSCTVTIVFSLPMNIETIAEAVDLSPDVDHRFLWNENNTILRIEFETDLQYNTSYTIVIASAKAVNGKSMENTPFVLTFRTVVPPWIKITSPLPGTIVGPGEFITVSGTSFGIAEGTKFQVSFGDYSYDNFIGTNGIWLVKIRAPESDGDYLLTVTVDNLTSSLNFTVVGELELTEAPQREKEDKTALWAAAIFIVGMMLVLFLILMLIIRKKRKDRSLKEEESESEKGKPIKKIRSITIMKKVKRKKEDLIGDEEFYQMEDNEDYLDEEE